MLTKIKNIVTSQFWQNLRDYRFLGLLALGLIVLMTSWSGVRIIETNYGLQQDIVALEKKNELRKIENQNLQLTNNYYQTDTFLELVAREQFNKGSSGEHLVLVPREVAKAKVPDQSTTDTGEPEPKTIPRYQQNFSDWLDFLFRRNQNT